MTKNTDGAIRPREASDPVAELSRTWAAKIAAQIPTEYAVSLKPWSPYTGNPVPGDYRLGAMIEYGESVDGTQDGRPVRILTYVAVRVRHDGAREVRVQVYGKNTGGVSREFLTRDQDGPAVDELLARIGGWVFRVRLEVAASITH